MGLPMDREQRDGGFSDRRAKQRFPPTRFGNVSRPIFATVAYVSPPIQCHISTSGLVFPSGHALYYQPPLTINSHTRVRSYCHVMLASCGHARLYRYVHPPPVTPVLARYRFGHRSEKLNYTFSQLHFLLTFPRHFAMIATS